MVGWIVLLACSAWMAAVGWYVGLVHYPTFHFVRAEDWSRFHALHVQKTGLVVGPPLIGQILATAWISVEGPLWAIVASWICCALSVGWTAIVSGPLHQRMTLENRRELTDRLVRTNAPRAIAWTVQAVICGLVLLGA